VKERTKLFALTSDGRMAALADLRRQAAGDGVGGEDGGGGGVYKDDEDDDEDDDDDDCGGGGGGKKKKAKYGEKAWRRDVLVICRVGGQVVEPTWRTSVARLGGLKTKAVKHAKVRPERCFSQLPRSKDGE